MPMVGPQPNPFATSPMIPLSGPGQDPALTPSGDLAELQAMLSPAFGGIGTIIQQLVRQAQARSQEQREREERERAGRWGGDVSGLSESQYLRAAGRGGDPGRQANYVDMAARGKRNQVLRSMGIDPRDRWVPRPESGQSADEYRASVEKARSSRTKFKEERADRMRAQTQRLRERKGNRPGFATAVVPGQDGGFRAFTAQEGGPIQQQQFSALDPALASTAAARQRFEAGVVDPDLELQRILAQLM